MHTCRSNGGANKFRIRKCHDAAVTKVLAPSYALHKSFPDVKPETLTANICQP